MSDWSVTGLVTGGTHTCFPTCVYQCGCPWTCYISVVVFYKSRCSSKRILFQDCIMWSSFFRAILLFTFKPASKIYSDTPRSPLIWCSLKRTKTSLYATESKLQGHCHVPYILSIRGAPTPEGLLVFKESRINTFLLSFLFSPPKKSAGFILSYNITFQ